ncbi:MAG: YmaF family protein [Bacillota bacterium]
MSSIEPDTQPVILTESSVENDTRNTEQVPDQNIEGHVHEFEGSTKLAEECEDRHNHRFAGVTSEMIVVGDNHIHGILENTDFLDHHHQIAAISGFAIDVGNDKHVHVFQSTTSMVDGHFHDFIFATLIPRPLV